VATIYAGQFIGGPLYCGGIYEIGTEPWVALDVSMYRAGWVKCGDKLWLQFPNGTGFSARAMDAGMFSQYHVDDWGDVPIVVDVPEFLSTFEGLSSPVTIYNISRWHREYGLRRKEIRLNGKRK
jgi:hypothetical protein